MPISKKRKYPKKRTSPVIIPASSGFVASFNFGGLDIPNRLLKALRKEGKLYHAFGREDKASGAAALSLEEFIIKFDTKMSSLPEAFDATITEAQHAQYLDGYEGRAYHDRVVFRRDNI